MKRLKLLLVALGLFSLLGCSTRKMMNVLQYATPYTGDVIIKGMGETIPENAILLGNVFVGEAGFTANRNCTFQQVMSDVRTLAKEMGGNMIVITKHQIPNTEKESSTCHQITANVYLIPKE